MRLEDINWKKDKNGSLCLTGKDGKILTYTNLKQAYRKASEVHEHKIDCFINEYQHPFRIIKVV